jgi:hypothetical protein
MTNTFARIVGWLALLLGILGFFVTDLLGLIQFDLTTNIVNLVLGVLGIAAAQSATGAKMYAQWLGAIYLLFGVISFFFTEIGGMHMEVTENLLHIILGGWGLYAVFGVKSATE